LMYAAKIKPVAVPGPIVERPKPTIASVPVISLPFHIFHLLTKRVFGQIYF